MENGKKTLIKNMHCNIGQYWTFLEFHLPYLGLGRMKQFDKLQKQYHLERLPTSISASRWAEGVMIIVHESSLITTAPLSSGYL